MANRLPNWRAHYERPDESYPDWVRALGTPEDDYIITDEEIEEYLRFDYDDYENYNQ